MSCHAGVVLRTMIFEIVVSAEFEISQAKSGCLKKEWKMEGVKPLKLSVKITKPCARDSLQV